MYSIFHTYRLFIPLDVHKDIVSRFLEVLLDVVTSETEKTY